jgi:penicillin-binding protein 1C
LLRHARRRRPRLEETAARRSLAVALSASLLVALLLATCQGSLAGARSVSAGVRDALRVDPIGLPKNGPLDRGLPQTATIIARDGSVLAELNDVHFGSRRAVPLSEIAHALVLATLAAEDRRFFNHPGLDLPGLVRALAQNAESEEVTSGASTLEMQLVRNLFLPDERTEQTLSRKLKEARAALQLNQRFSKEELLEAYLNTVYYGNQAYGAEAAAQRYFGRPARELSLPEAALLAGLPQSPSAFDPLRQAERARRRQEHVLDLMVQAAFITPEQAAAAKAAPLPFVQRQAPPPSAPHWVNYIQDTVRERFGPEALFTGGLRIRTTLDPAVQELAEEVVASNEDVRQRGHANNTAMVVLDPRTNQVLAMVGSKDFRDASIDGQVNVTLAERQPGSSIKPVVYLAAFEAGLNPAVQVRDQPTLFSAPPGQPPYSPTNWEGRFVGLVTLRDALGNSLNVPAVKVLKYVGVPAFQDMARRLGLTTLDTWDPRWLSITLGGGGVKLLEMVGAYATIAREGIFLPVEPLLSVETSRGDVLYGASEHPVGKQVVDPRVAYQLLHVMGDVTARQVTFGWRSPLNLKRPHMLKTGTTDDFRDTWTIGCLPQVCVGVWMGNTNSQPMVRVSSSLTAGKFFVDMMQALIDRFDYEPEPFPRPEGVIVTRVANVGNARPSSPSMLGLRDVEAPVDTDHEEVFLPGRDEQFLLEMDWRRLD